MLPEAAKAGGLDDPYATLGVKRGASAAEIKKAYRRAAKAHHPDLNPGDDGAAERFKRVQAAYEVLSDPVGRTRFDRDGTTASTRGGGRRRASAPPPDPAVPMAYTRAVAQAADRMRAMLLDELLPRYIDAAYRGMGAELVWRLLDDVEQYRLLMRLSSPEPSARARRMAEHTAARVRVDVRPLIVEDRGRPVLGRALQDLQVVHGKLQLVWRVQVFAGSLHTVGHRATDQLDMVVLQLLATELVRVLEHTLPHAVRPLESRELLLPRPTLHDAQWADRRHVVNRAGTVAFVILVILGLSLMIVPGFVM